MHRHCLETTPELSAPRIQIFRVRSLADFMRDKDALSVPTAPYRLHSSVRIALKTGTMAVCGIPRDESDHRVPWSDTPGSTD